MQRLLIFQSLWAMERLARPGRPDWNLEEKLHRIADAGFDGIELSASDPAQAARMRPVLAERGLRCSVVCFPRTVEEIEPAIDLALDLGATHINLQGNVKPFTVAECLPYLEGWLERCRRRGVPVFVETHRDRMTTDLFFTLQLMDAVPGMEMTADLSHCVVGREFAWPISDENHELIRRVLRRAGAFHGRVASREQVQIQHSFPHHRDWLDLFLGWWEEGFCLWRARSPADAALTFLCELGPPEYAITGPDGRELSDRWEEALMLKDMVREVWTGIEENDV